MRRSTLVSATSLTLALLGAAPSAPALANNERVDVIKPPEQSARATRSALDDEHFEIGLSVGRLSVEDFESNTSATLSFNYYPFDRWVVQGLYGRADISRATFETVAGGNFLGEDDRVLEYQGVLGGYQVLNGRSFFGARRKFNSYLYLLAGPAQVDFAGEQNSGGIVGVSYKTVLTDWMTLNLDFRDIVAERHFLGADKTTHNLEVSIGLGVIF